MRAVADRVIELLPGRELQRAVRLRATRVLDVYLLGKLELLERGLPLKRQGPLELLRHLYSWRHRLVLQRELQSVRQARGDLPQQGRLNASKPVIGVTEIGVLAPFMALLAVAQTTGG